jgi:hypothetical protein
MKSGGRVCEYLVDRSGDNLLRPAKLEEIVPDEQYYMQSVYKRAEFIPTIFHHKVSYDTIKEFHRTGRIFITNGN